MPLFMPHFSPRGSGRKGPGRKVSKRNKIIDELRTKRIRKESKISKSLNSTKQTWENVGKQIFGEYWDFTHKGKEIKRPFEEECAIGRFEKESKEAVWLLNQINNLPPNAQKMTKKILRDATMGTLYIFEELEGKGPEGWKQLRNKQRMTKIKSLQLINQRKAGIRQHIYEVIVEKRGTDKKENKIMNKFSSDDFKKMKNLFYNPKKFTREEALKAIKNSDIKTLN